MRKNVTKKYAFSNNTKEMLRTELSSEKLLLPKNETPKKSKGNVNQSWEYAMFLNINMEIAEAIIKSCAYISMIFQ